LEKITFKDLAQDALSINDLIPLGVSQLSN